MKKVWVLLNDNLVLGAYSSEFKAERAMFRREQDDEAEGDNDRPWERGFTYYTIQESEIDEV
jgi:hypothetical protein